MTSTYDTGLTYGSEARYAGGPVQPQTPKAMNKIKLELNSKSDAELLIFGKNHDTKMTGNATFPAPVPPAGTFDLKLTAYEDALTGIAGLLNDLDGAYALRDAARIELENALRDRASHVETVSAGDATLIASAGFEIVGPASPIGVLPAPLNLRAGYGVNAGELMIRWKRVKGAGSYILECREHSPVLGAWQLVKIVTRAGFTVTGLVTGKEYSFRVRAVGTAGEGPWSDEAVKNAP